MGLRLLQIGISGFTPGQVDQVMRKVGDVPEGMQLRLGVSCSYHGLMNLPDPRSRPNLFVGPGEIGRMLMSARCDPRTNRVIHYSSTHPTCPSPIFSLRDQVARLLEIAEGQLDGLQLNDVTLKPFDLTLIKRDFARLELTVPITGKMQRQIVSMPWFDGEYRRLLELADWLLLDASAGSGKELDVDLTSACLNQLDKWGLTAGRMLAGGLGPGLGDVLGPLAEKHRFGVDAEGKLRRGDVLQPDLAVAYARDAIKLLSAM